MIYPNILKGYYATAIFYAAARFLIRISIILFYTRVFRTPWAKRLIWGSFIFSVLISIPPILVIAFECTPVSYYWSRWDGEHAGHCINTKAFIWAVFVLLLLNDLCNATLSLFLHLNTYLHHEVVRAWLQNSTLAKTSTRIIHSSLQIRD